MKITLKALRVNAGLSQKEVAKKLGISNNTLIKWERYLSYPRVLQLDKMCKLYGCSMDDIFLPDNLTKSE